MNLKWKENVANILGLGSEKSLYVKVIRACKKCGAGGVDEFGRPIVGRCPKCGAKRPRVEDLGKVWSSRKEPWWKFWK